MSNIPDITKIITEMSTFGAKISVVGSHEDPVQNSSVRDISICQDRSESNMNLDTLKRVLCARLSTGDADFQNFEFVKIEDVTIKGDFPDAIY